MARTNEPLMIRGIRRDGGTQMRVSLDEATIERYAEDMRNNRWEWGPHNYLVVFHDKSERPEGVYWLADGFHRIEAAQRAGWASVKCRVEEGGRRDAVLLAAGANASHGLGRSRDDVQRSIRTLLLDDEWRKWSDRAIAEKVHCDHKTVGSLREKLILSGEIPHEEERVYSRAGATHTQAAPPPPPARPAGAPSAKEYEAAAVSLLQCGYVLSSAERNDRQIGWPPYWIVNPKGASKRIDTWAEVYEAMIAVANNQPALAELRLTIGADKSVGEAQHAALQAAITRRSEQLESPAAQPAAEALPPELERVAEALRRRDIDAGYAAARVASPYYERAMAAVDALVDGKPLDELLALLHIPYAIEQKRQAAPKAEPKAEPERITIQTSDGPRQVLPIFRTDYLALAPFAGSYSITHLESGAKIGPEIKDRHLAEQRFSLLADLDWSAGLTEELRIRAREICGLPNEDEDLRFSQLRTRATALGCSIVTYQNRRGLLRQGEGEIASTGSLDLDHLENLIASLERVRDVERVSALTDRANALGYRISPHGSRWRISRGESPMGAAADLDDLERSVIAWEQAQERAQQPEPAEEPKQAEPAPRSPLYEHATAMLSGLIEKAEDQELRLMYLLIYGQLPSDFGDEDQDISEEVWQGGMISLENMLPGQLAWLLGEALAQ